MLGGGGCINLNPDIILKLQDIIQEHHCANTCTHIQENSIEIKEILAIVDLSISLNFSRYIFASERRQKRTMIFLHFGLRDT